MSFSSRLRLSPSNTTPVFAGFRGKQALCPEHLFLKLPWTPWLGKLQEPGRGDTGLKVLVSIP